jgi:cytidine deaminase
MIPKGKEDTYRKLIESAKHASDLAYCRYSSYPVGAAVLTFDGQVYTGCNVENCGYTQTIHAEQTAMANALSDGALRRALDVGLTQLDFIEAIAVHAKKSPDPWPCCNCRQSLNEFGLAMNVIGQGDGDSIKCETLGELIPHAFPMESVLESVHGKDWRTVGARASVKTAKQIKTGTGSNGAGSGTAASGMHELLIERAKDASRLAYCPYSNYPVGAAILTFDNQIYTGCNIENCGYTQTIHAEQTALSKAISMGSLKRAEEAGLTQFDFIKAIAIYSPKTIEPWPSCNGRQALNEFGLQMEVIGEGQNGEILCKKLEELIPFAFPMEAVLSAIHNAE